MLRLVQSCKVRSDWGVARWREARTEQGRVETRSQTDRLTLTLKEANAGPFFSLQTLALHLRILVSWDRRW